jgi:hypothetical protein
VNPGMTLQIKFLKVNDFTRCFHLVYESPIHFLSGFPVESPEEQNHYISRLEKEGPMGAQKIG